MKANKNIFKNSIKGKFEIAQESGKVGKRQVKKTERKHIKIKGARCEQ